MLYGVGFLHLRTKSVKVSKPLQSILELTPIKWGNSNALIIVDEGASANYVEGCTAPVTNVTRFTQQLLRLLL